MATVTKPIVLDETLKETNEILRGLSSLENAVRAETARNEAVSAKNDAQESAISAENSRLGLLQTLTNVQASASSVESTESASATASLVDSSLEFSFEIPKGEKGEKGEVGAGVGEFKQDSEGVVSLTSDDTSAVVLTSPQTLTDEQKQNARQNIGLPSDIATTEEVEEVRRYAETLRKRVINLEASSQGKTYIFESDTTEAYSKAVPSGALPFSSLKSWGGKSVVWNQILDALSTNLMILPNLNNYLVADGKVTVSNKTATQAWKGYTLSAVAGHKYYVAYSKLSDDQDGSFPYPHQGKVYSKNSSSALTELYSGEQKTSIDSIVTAPSDSVFLEIRFGTSNNTVTTLPIVCDLTKMFGSGNEPTSIDDYRIAFIKSYAESHPDFASGEIQSANIGNIKSSGRNLISPSSLIDGKWIDNMGVESSNTEYKLTPYISVSSATKYAVSNRGTSRLKFFDASFNVINGGSYEYGSGEIVVTSPNNARYVRVTILNEMVSLAYFIEKDTIGYEPYWTENYPIPEAVRQLSGYGWSAGTAKNWVEHTDDGKWLYHKEVSRYDLGTVDFTYRSGNRFSYTCNGVIEYKKTASINFINDKFTAFEPVGGLAGLPSTDCITLYNNTISESKIIYLVDTTTDDARILKQKLSGSYFYYEQETPEVTDISDLIPYDNLLEVEAGGSITFENSHGDNYRIPVPNEIEYQIKVQ